MTNDQLKQRLAGLRRRLRLVVTVRGVSWLLSLVLAAAAGAGWLDWVHPLPPLARALILVAVLGSAGVIAYRHLLRPLLARVDDLSLALRVEELYPELTDSLASTVEFLEQPEDSDRSGSPGMRLGAAVRQTLRQVQDRNFKKAINTRGLPTAGLSLVAATALAVFLVLPQPTRAWTALARLADPFGGHDWPHQTQLVITDFRPRVARGQSYEIHALVTGVLPDHADVEYKGLTPQLQTYPIDRGRLVARLDQVRDGFRFQVQAGDAASDWYQVSVLPPPVLVPWQDRPSPQVHLRYPAYTDLPEQDLPDGSGNIDAVAGTRATFRAATDRPVAQAWIDYRPEQPTERVPSPLGVLGASHPLATLTLAAAGESASARVPVRLEENGQVLAAEFTPPTVTGTYSLHFEDDTGLGNTRLFDLRVRPDPAPTVALDRPSRSRDSLDVLPGADVHIAVTAEDREFALRSVSLEYRCATDVTPRLLPLYDHQAVGLALPSLLAGLGGSPLSGATPVPGLRLRPRQLQIAQVLSLNRIKHSDGTDLREGDVVTLQALADDFDDVAVNKEPGRSGEVELRVVSPAVLEANLNLTQTQVQQELLHLRKLQQEALEHVIGPEQRWRDTGRLEPRDVDQLRQAEQLQQQVRSRVGTKDEGLRAEVARALETMRDNHLPSSGAQERLETVARELDRLAREELEQIEPRLTNARKENELAGDHPQPPADRKGPLDEARQHQEEVENTLNDLLKLLEPWGSINEIKGEARALREEQGKLNEQTQGLDTDKDRGRDRDALPPDKKAALDGLAEMQKKLGERAQQLLEKMDRVGQDRQGKSPETANALKEAGALGKEKNIPGQMKEAGNAIQENHVGRAADAQKRSLQGLDQVVQALEEHHEKELDQLRKKLKKAEDQVANLAKDQDELRKKMKEAGQVADASERERQLKELGRQQDEVRKRSQDLARQLKELRADQAAQALQDAGAGMEQAARQLTRNDNPDDSQQEALDRLQEAQRQLKKGQAEADDELQREKLVKVADQLKLLKARQEAALAESQRLQTAALQGQDWTRPLRSSLGDLAESQQGLARETKDLAENKLGPKVPVFAHILTRSAEFMKQAADQIQNHLTHLNDQHEDTAEDTETRRLQEDVVRRLGQLIDAISAQTDSVRRPGGGEAGGGQGGGGGGQNVGGGQEADDNIPPLAQLKVLRAIQEGINQRTEAFARKHPGAAKLNAGEKRDLEAIRTDQEEVVRLFNDLMHPAGEGEKP